MPSKVLFGVSRFASVLGVNKKKRAVDFVCVRARLASTQRMPVVPQIAKLPVHFLTAPMYA